MDLNSHPDSDQVLPKYPIWNPPVPEAIVADHSDETYLVCWKPAEGGVIHRNPGLVKKEDVRKGYPHILKAWEAKQHDEEEQARQMEENFVKFAGRFLDSDSDKDCAAPLKRGVACEQSLRPGMSQHWGELRKCENHPPNRPDVLVCKGCRVSHYAQECRTFDRLLIMARGARVPVCEKCANIALAGVEPRDCVCDSRWTCFRCREVELEKLAKARENYIEGRCGECSEVCGLEQYVDFCLRCRGWRVYANTMERLEATADVE